MKNHAKANQLVGQANLKFLCNGKIEGILLDLGKYPGAKEHKGKFVYGEVYEISDCDVIFKKLDKYEEFNANNPKESLFVRKKINVFLDDGKNATATVYLYNCNTKDPKVIPDGKWRNHTHSIKKSKTQQ
jgi:gamma-glutamylcyclotransferase (GGCT)/AIG2-like uncharacterized protein YtfP